MVDNVLDIKMTVEIVLCVKKIVGFVFAVSEGLYGRKWDGQEKESHSWELLKGLYVFSLNQLHPGSSIAAACTSRINQTSCRSIWTNGFARHAAWVCCLSYRLCTVTEDQMADRQTHHCGYENLHIECHSGQHAQIP